MCEKGLEGKARMMTLELQLKSAKNCQAATFLCLVSALRLICMLQVDVMNTCTN